MRGVISSAPVERLLCKTAGISGIPEDACEEVGLEPKNRADLGLLLGVAIVGRPAGRPVGILIRGGAWVLPECAPSGEAGVGRGAGCVRVTWKDFDE